jgi:hypothetical protein
MNRIFFSFLLYLVLHASAFSQGTSSSRNILHAANVNATITEQSIINSDFIMAVEPKGSCELRYRDGSEMAQIKMNVAAKSLFSADFQPEYNTLFGAGKRLVWKTQLHDNLTAEFWLSSYDLHTFILMGGTLTNTGSSDVYINSFDPFEIDIKRQNIANKRLFINSGTQGFSGSISLSDPKALSKGGYPCSTLCVYQGSHRDDCVGIGSVTMRRTEILLERTIENNTLIIRPSFQYDKVRLDAGETIRLETLLIGNDSHGGNALLNQWAEVAAQIIQPQFNRSMVGLYNTWYAYYTKSNDHGTEDLILKSTRELEKSGLDKYGINIVLSGIWQNRAAFSEHETWPNLMPHGYAWINNQISKSGFQMAHGGFWSKVHECSTVFKQHPEWLVKDFDGKPLMSKVKAQICPYFFGDLDLTNPQAFEWLKQQSMFKFADMGGKFYWLDFFGAMSRRDMYDSAAFSRPKGAVTKDDKIVLPTEVDRKHVKALREILGDGSVIETYTSPTNHLVGLVDRVRMAQDCGSIDPSPNSPDLKAAEAEVIDVKSTNTRWTRVQAVARNMAAAYFYHDKLWMNDPDPIMVGRIERPETLEEARVRVMITANSGGYPTIGEAPEHMDTARLALLKKALPVYGRAATPLDLMDNTVPSVYHLHAQHSYMNWDIITIFNWEDRPSLLSVALEDIGLYDTYHAFEFWTQDYIGVVNRELTLKVPARSCRVVRLTAKRDLPQIIGSDRHVSMGIMELPVMHFDHDTSVLSGIAKRPLTENGVITICLPKGWQVKSAENIAIEQKADRLQGRLQFVSAGQPWKITFVKN